MADVTYHIDDARLDEFIECFLLAAPKPISLSGEPMSDAAWIKKWGRIQFFNVYREGKRMKAERAMIIDEGIIG